MHHINVILFALALQPLAVNHASAARGRHPSVLLRREGLQ